MKMKRSLVTTLVAIVISLSFAGTIRIHPASANPDAADVYIYPATRASATSGTAYTYQVRLNATAGQGAPHETTEPYPGLGTDKTRAWEVVITYDPAVLQVTTDPDRDTVKDWFNFFHKYSWSAEIGEWKDLGPYVNFYAMATDNTKGEVAAVCTIGEDIPSKPLPVDDFGDKSFSQAALHLGDYYDLPWSEGLQGLAGYTYDHFVLYNFSITPLVNIGLGYPVVETTLHVSVASFFQYDHLTTYTVITADATIGTPSIPEFPLGLAPVIMLAPLIPIIYIWRTRKKRSG